MKIRGMVGRERASQVALVVKKPPANAGGVETTRVPPLGWEDPLQEGTATHPSVLAWRTRGRGAGRATVGSHSRTRLGMGSTLGLGSRAQAWGEGTGEGGGCPVSLASEALRWPQFSFLIVNGVWAERRSGARPLRLCVVSLQGLAVAKGGNRCLGAAGSLTVSDAHC